MKLFLSVLLLLFNLIIFHPIHAEEKFTEFELRSLAKDIDFNRESVELEKIFNALFDVIEFQNYQQNEINETIVQFFDSDMTNEELWVILDEINVNTEGLVEEVNELVNSVNFTSSSVNENAKIFYSESVDLLYDVRSFIAKNNKVTVDLINFIAEGDIDSYENLQGRASLMNSDFLEIIVKKNLSSANRLPSTTLHKHMLLIEAESTDFNLSAQRIVGYAQSGDLSRKLFSEIESLLKTKYRTFKKSKARVGLAKVIKELETASKDSTDIDQTSKEAIEQLTINAQLYADSLTRNTELWNEIYLFYKKHINNLDALNSDPKTIASYNSLQSRHYFALTETQKYAGRFQESNLAVLEILPELYK